jgi:mycothione reductase
MKSYDIIVIGAGAGLEIVFKTLSTGLKVALLDKGNVGGTCLKVGGVPSKMLIYPADRIREIEEAKKLGIHARIDHIDFRSIMERMKKAVKSGVNSIAKEIRNSKNIDFYNDEAHFVGEYLLETKNGKIRGEKLFIVSGARPIIPPIKGLDKIEYLTNETVLDLKRRPESLIIIGGGYIAVEYAHFFSAVGTSVVIVGRNKRLIPNEDPEISALAKKELAKRMGILTGTEVLEVRRRRKAYAVLLKKKNTGEQKEILAEKVMVAVGRESNADLLKVQNTGVETTADHYIKVNDYLQTTKNNIWALGDAIGRQMFTHAASEEVELAWHNATQKRKRKMNFRIVPHAVFTRPQIASVGVTEKQARKDHEILVGKTKYSNTVKGGAMMEEEGFAKAIVEKGTQRILGFHIIGPEASTLIQEVVNVMAKGESIESITRSMHIFPALSQLIPDTFGNLK